MLPQPPGPSIGQDTWRRPDSIKCSGHCNLSSYTKGLSELGNLLNVR